MAYTPKSKMFGEVDEDKNRQSVAGAGGSFGTSTPSSTPAPMGSTSPGTSAPAVKQAPPPPSSQNVVGTGFVNMDRLLGANAGIGSQVAQAGTTALAKERSNLHKETDKFSDAVSKGSSVINNADLEPSLGRLFGGQAESGGSSHGGSTIYSQEANDEDKKAILSALGASYGGPSTFNYKPTGSLAEANALGNAKSTGKQLAMNAGDKIQGGVAGYDPMQSAIDRALYGTESSAVKATGDIAKGTKNLKTDINTYSKNANQRASDAATDVANSRQNLIDRLSGGAQAIISNAEAQAAAANARENELRKNPSGQNVETSPLTPEQQRQADAFGFTYSDPVFNPGSGPATAGNFVGQDSGKLDWIAKALGNPNLAIQNTGPYHGGSWSRTINPNAPPPQPSEDEETQRQINETQKRQDVLELYNSPGASGNPALRQRLEELYPWLKLPRN